MLILLLGTVGMLSLVLAAAAQLHRKLCSCVELSRAESAAKAIRQIVGGVRHDEILSHLSTRFASTLIVLPNITVSGASYWFVAGESFPLPRGFSLILRSCMVLL